MVAQHDAKFRSDVSFFAKPRTSRTKANKVRPFVTLRHLARYAAQTQG
jgi:hypothetical protein